MGFFGKIKQNLNHGGVKVYLQAPTTITSSQTEIPVKITLEAAQQCQVDSLEVSLERRFANAGSNNSPPPAPVVMGIAKQAGPFTLLPGQNQSFDLSITVSSPDSGGAMAQTFGKFANAVSSLGSQKFKHYICAKADVANIKLDPKAEQQVVWEGNEMPGITEHVNISLN